MLMGGLYLGNAINNVSIKETFNTSIPNDIEIHIGVSESNIIRVDIDTDVVTQEYYFDPTPVNQDYQGPDTFSITRGDNYIDVKRTDVNGGWGTDLKIHAKYGEVECEFDSDCMNTGASCRETSLNKPRRCLTEMRCNTIREEEKQIPGNIPGSCNPSLSCTDRENFFMQDLEAQGSKINFYRQNMQRYSYNREKKCDDSINMYEIEPDDPYNYEFIEPNELQKSYDKLNFQKDLLKKEKKNIEDLISKKMYSV